MSFIIIINTVQYLFFFYNSQTFLYFRFGWILQDGFYSLEDKYL